MGLVYADRVREIVAAPSGSNPFSISTTATWNDGWQTFAQIPGIATSDTVYYFAADTNGNVEVGQGTYSSGSLARTIVYVSNNANSPANFSGNVSLYCSFSAEWLSTFALLNSPAFTGSPSFPAPIPAALTATSATTYTAAQMLNGAIIRSGPTTDFTDTTATAANIVSSMPGSTINSGYNLTVSNTTAYILTLATASGVTQSGLMTISPSNSVTFRVTVTATGSTPAVTLTRIASGGV